MGAHALATECKQITCLFQAKKRVFLYGCDLTYYGWGNSARQQTLPPIFANNDMKIFP